MGDKGYACTASNQSERVLRDISTRPYHLLHVVHHSTPNTKDFSTYRQSTQPPTLYEVEHERHQIPTQSYILYMIPNASTTDTSISSYPQAIPIATTPTHSFLDDDGAAWTASKVRKEKAFILDHLPQQTPILTRQRHPFQVASTITGLYLARSTIERNQILATERRSKDP